MKHLFGPRGRAALDALRAHRPLLAFDFDGTLCPLHAKPDDSLTLPENLVHLRRLRSRAPVAIITGRAVADVSKRLGFKPTFVVGNHGLEGLDPRAADRAVRTVHAWREQLRIGAQPFADDPGVFTEDKKFSLSLHYRLARDPARAARWLRDRVARLTPTPRVIGGKYIFNLTVAGTAHKGTALAALTKKTRARSSLFVGDDVTDEDAFALPRPGLLTVRVNPARRSSAEYFVRELAGVTRLLEWLDDAL